MKKQKNPLGAIASSPSASLSRKQLALAVLLAISGSQLALAADEKIEEVMITGSRVRVTNGMETPNPVTVVTMDELSVTSPLTMVEGLAELPQFSGSNTTAAPANFFNGGGAGSLSLRGLQSKRTLTLLNGRRVVSSSINGGPDINLFPEMIMKSVETVTGGASAAYGTDAVSGAVNFILDTNFKGYRGTAQMGENYNGDNQNYKVGINGGWDLGTQAHLLLSASKFQQDAIRTRDGYDWYKGAGLLTNSSPTAGQTPDNPRLLRYNNVVSRIASLDGVVIFPAASGLGSWSIDSAGNATPFVLGSASDANFHSITNGGSGTDNGVDQVQLQPETSSENYFGYLDFDVNDKLNLFGQVIYGKSFIGNRNTGGAFGGSRAFTIFSGNPFLPANIQQMMTANNVASVSLGRMGSKSDLSVDAYNEQDTKMSSVTTGFNYNHVGGFFNDWNVTGYLQTGHTDVDFVQRGGQRIDRIYLAADAVKDASGNVVCNVTRVSGQYKDCVPINLFGRGRPSPAAVDWVTGFDPGVAVNVNGWLPNGESIPYSYVGDANKHRVLDYDQDVWEISANGEIAKGWGAGPISMATGYAWRKESFVQKVQASQGNPTTDPNVRPVAANNAALGIRGVPAADSSNSVEFQFSKVPFGRGSFKVREAFVEFRVPLLSGIKFIKQLDTDFAARWANYSGSGDVWSWKGGAEWRVTDEFRLRGTVSQDVRAANMGERFDRTGGLTPQFTDWLEDPNGGTASRYSGTLVSGGNPNVKPEEAKTLTAGFVYQPAWLDGLQMSFDWYNVDVRDNISLLGTVNIVDNCYLRNDPDSCALIERDGPVSTIKPGLKRISIVNDVYTNINSQEAQGIDFELQYRTDINLFGGGERLNLRMIGSKLQHNTNRNSVGAVTHNEGGFGLPEFNIQYSVSYVRGPLSASLQLRRESGTWMSAQNNIFQSSLGRIRYDTLDNTVDSSSIVDARIGYNLQVMGVDMNVFLSANNLLNQDPQELLTTGPDATIAQAVGNGVVGDLRGRRFVLGVNFDF